MVPVSKNLVGTGELLTTTQSLKELNEKQKEKVLEAFNRKFGDLDITTANLNLVINADMEMGASGLAVPLSINLDDQMKLDFGNQKAHQDVTGNIELFGMKMDLEMDSYFINEDDRFVSYSQISSLDQAGGWQKETVDKNIFEEYEIIPGTLKEETVKTVYQTEDASQYLIEMDAKQLPSFTDMFERFNTGTSDLTVDFSGLAAYVTVDEGMEMVGYYIDLKDGINVAANDMEVDVSSMTVSMKFSSLNEEEEIELPKEAKDAEENPESSQESLLNIIEKETEKETEEETEEETKDAAADIEPAGEPEPEETESSEKKESVSAMPSKVSGVDIVLDGKPISFPCAVSDLKTVGMTIEEEVQINPGDFKVIVGNMGGEDDFYLTAHNDTGNTISSNDAVVRTIGYDAYLVENPVDYSVCGIKTGMSMDDAEAVLGEPVGLYTGSSGYVSKDYTAGSYEISIGYNDNMVSSIDISH